MLRAAAMLGGLAVLWTLVTQRWSSPQDWAIAAGVSFVCVVVALRAGGASAAFLRAPRLVVLSATRAGVLVRGAMATIRAALSADVTMKPALVRIKTRAAPGSQRASFAYMLSSTPGVVVVDTDADGCLVHVIDEDSIDPADLGRLEDEVSGVAGARG